MIGDVVDVLGTASLIRNVTVDLVLQPIDWMEEQYPGNHTLRISPETLPEVDADLVFLVGHYALIETSPAATDAESESFLPGSDRFLPAAREGGVVYLDGRAVLTDTFASAPRVLHALEMHFSDATRKGAE